MVLYAFVIFNSYNYTSIKAEDIPITIHSASAGLNHRPNFTLLLMYQGDYSIL